MIIITILSFNIFINNCYTSIIKIKFNSIIQKHNELAEIVNELKTKVETYSNKINELEQRVHQLENAIPEAVKRSRTCTQQLPSPISSA